VSAHDNVLDLEVADRVVNHGHDVEVDVINQVGDVAVDEHLAGFEARDGFGGDARVGAAWQDGSACSSVGVGVDKSIVVQMGGRTHQSRGTQGFGQR
jgi:hypothetical protein